MNWSPRTYSYTKSYEAIIELKTCMQYNLPELLETIHRTHCRGHGVATLVRYSIAAPQLEKRVLYKHQIEKPNLKKDILFYKHLYILQIREIENNSL